VQLLLKHLRAADLKDAKRLELAEELSIHDRVVKFSAARDAAIEKLRLDSKAVADLWKGVLECPAPKPLDEPATPQPVEGSAQ
jgi:hypothetical protein